jgi:hypothetical protein
MVLGGVDGALAGEGPERVEALIQRGNRAAEHHELRLWAEAGERAGCVVAHHAENYPSPSRASGAFRGSVSLREGRASYAASCASNRPTETLAKPPRVHEQPAAFLTLAAAIEALLARSGRRSVEVRR